MIDLYFWPTPNGYKITLFLEEAGVPYRVIPVDIGSGAQFAPDFLKISPNNRMPAIVDPEGPSGAYSLFESGAILIYLAEKFGKFLPGDPGGRYRTIEWVMFQMGGVGPMMGQNGHFINYAPEPIPYALNRYGSEVKRLFGVLDRRLGETGAYVAGGAYSIADMAIFPWVRNHERHKVAIADFPRVGRWIADIDARPATAKALAVGAEWRRQGPPTPEQREVLFGATQYQRR